MINFVFVNEKQRKMNAIENEANVCDKQTMRRVQTAKVRYLFEFSKGEF